jgi:hypothetical protein
MKISLKTSLLLTFFLSSIVAQAQDSVSSTKGQENTQASAYAFDTDARASVKSFRQPLKDYYAELQKKNPDPTALKDAREQLRFSSNAITATVKTNPGLGLLLVKAIKSDIENSVSADVTTGLSEIRPDKQVFAQSGSAGSTSLVAKAGGASILAMAVDSGALTKSASGTTSTISGNLEGIGSFLLGQAPISIDPDKQNWLRKTAGDVNLSATFALAQPSSQTTASTQPATGTSPPAGTQVDIPSSVGKLTGITAQFAIHNPFDPHSGAIRTRWDAAKDDLQKSASSMLQATEPLMDALDCGDACTQDWSDAITALNAAAQEHNPQKFADAYDNYVNAVIAHAMAADPNINAEVVTAAKATAAYQAAVKDAVDKTLGNLFTLEYDYAKPANQPETHDFKLVYGYAMSSVTAINSLLTAGSSSKSLFTANADISIYGGAIPATAKYGRLRSGQLSAEFDTPILGTPPAKLAVFSLAGYWQYQPNPSVLNITQSDVAPGTSIPAPTQVLVGTAGSLWVTQAKITINNGKSGISVPFGVKWSNKSDLLSGNKVGAQVGISYDFSSLNNLFGGSN